MNRVRDALVVGFGVAFGILVKGDLMDGVCCVLPVGGRTR